MRDANEATEDSDITLICDAVDVAGARNIDVNNVTPNLLLEQQQRRVGNNNNNNNTIETATVNTNITSKKPITTTATTTNDDDLDLINPGDIETIRMIGSGSCGEVSNTLFIDSFHSFFSPLGFFGSMERWIGCVQEDLSRVDQG